MHFVMKDLFSCKMMGSPLYNSQEEEYQIYTIYDKWARKHDASGPDKITD